MAYIYTHTHGREVFLAVRALGQQHLILMSGFFVFFRRQPLKKKKKIFQLTFYSLPVCAATANNITLAHVSATLVYVQQMLDDSKNVVVVDVV